MIFLQGGAGAGHKWHSTKYVTILPCGQGLRGLVPGKFLG
jgi:hypothetical protein